MVHLKGSDLHAIALVHHALTNVARNHGHTSAGKLLVHIATDMNMKGVGFFEV